MGVGDSSQVQQITNQFIKRNLNLRLTNLICILDALSLHPDGMSFPVEGGPATAGYGTGMS
jgi:hypothetical protein